MKYEKHLHAQGFAFIPGSWNQRIYCKTISNFPGISELTLQMHRNYSNLVLDPYSPGNRFRAYSQCRINDDESLQFGQFEPYFQTQAYNPDTGGIIRNYPPIHQDVTNNPLFLSIIINDIDFIERYGKTNHPKDTIIGIHLFRYFASPMKPAFSSPAWLHRDDEDIVFIHLIGLSENAHGADNIIARDSRHIERVMRLEQPFDTLVVNHAKLHAVTPLWCNSTEENITCTRDIILVTFQNRGIHEK